MQTHSLERTTAGLEPVASRNADNFAEVEAAKGDSVRAAPEAPEAPDIDGPQVAVEAIGWEPLLCKTVASRTFATRFE